MRRTLVIAACATLACADQPVSPNLVEGTIAGVVTRAGAPTDRAAVRVQLESCATPAQCATLPQQGAMLALSDAAGRYRLEGLPPGRYRVAAFPPPALAATPVSRAAVAVEAGQTTTLDIAFTSDTISPPPTGLVATVTLTVDKATVSVGDSLNALAMLAAADGQPIYYRPIAWSVDPPSLLSLEPYGHSAVMRARGTGSARVTAVSEGRSGSVTVTIN